jgi:hypothetical protein
MTFRETITSVAGQEGEGHGGGGRGGRDTPYHHSEIHTYKYVLLKAVFSPVRKVELTRGGSCQKHLIKKKLDQRTKTSLFKKLAAP